MSIVRMYCHIQGKQIKLSIILLPLCLSLITASDPKTVCETISKIWAVCGFNCLHQVCSIKAAVKYRVEQFVTYTEKSPRVFLMSFVLTCSN